MPGSNFNTPHMGSTASHDANEGMKPQDNLRPQDDLSSKPAPSESDTTPAAGGVQSPWDATAPTEIQLRPAMRLLGEHQTNGRPTPLRVCGYIFRISDILNWMDSQQLIPELVGSPAARADRGWSYVVNTLGPRGISCWSVRTHLVDEHGNRTKWKCVSNSLILGSNETKRERLATRDMKKIRLIHKVLGIPMGALGAPEWLIPVE